MKKLTLKRALPLIALGASIALPQSATAQDKSLTMAEPDWTGGLVTCTILESVANDMGYSVERVPLPYGAPVDEGIRSGDVDFGCEAWPSFWPSKSEHIEKWGGDGSVAYLGPTGVVSISGYYVPRYVIEGDEARGIEPVAPELKTWEDLNRYAEVFSTFDSGGKGRLIVCPVAAWECKGRERVEALGLDFVTVELGSETAHWAELQGLYKRGEPFLAYAWEPHWSSATMDLVSIELPEYSEEEWPATGWPEDVTYNFGTPTLVETHPDFAAFVGAFRLSNAEQASMIYDIDIEGRSVSEVVDEWLKDNEERIGGSME